MNQSIRPYHTLGELLGKKVVVADLVQALSRIPRSDVIRCIAGMTVLLEREGASELKQQLVILHGFATSGLARSIESAVRKLNGPFGVLFHRRQLWFVLQMAVIACKDDLTLAHDDAAARQVGDCCLMASDVLKQVESAPETDKDETKHSIGFAMTAFISYAELAFGSEFIARSHLFWREMPQDAAIYRLMEQIGIQRPLAVAFEDKYGLSLDEFMNYLLVLYHQFAEATLQQPPRALMYDSTTAFQSYFRKELIDAALRLVSTTPDVIAARLLGLPRQSWATDVATLVRTPLWELSPNKYVCPDLHMFRAFLVHGIFELLMDAGDPEKIKQLLGGLFESYVDRLIRSFAPSSEVLVNSYLNPVVFDSEKKPEACDGLLLWPSMAVLLECKTNMLTSRQRYAMSLKETTKAIDDQLAKFTDPGEANSGRARKGVGQLAYNLYRVLRGERVLHNGKPVDLLSVPKLYPAIVIYDEGMANHLVRLHLNTRMVEWFGKNGVDHARVGHVLLFTTRDMEYFEMLAQRIGAEKVMREYANYVEANPRDPRSMFTEYAWNKYPEIAGDEGGYTRETVQRVLGDLESEMRRRKAVLEGV